MTEKQTIFCWCFTFGANHKYWVGDDLMSLGKRYAKISAPTEGEAREIMHRVRANKWAFNYPEEGFQRQIDSYGLTEVDVNDLSLDPDDPYGERG